MIKYFVLIAACLGSAPAFAAQSSSNNPASVCCDCPTKTCDCYSQAFCGGGDAPIRAETVTPVAPGGDVPANSANASQAPST